MAFLEGPGEERRLCRFGLAQPCLVKQQLRKESKQICIMMLLSCFAVPGEYRIWLVFSMVLYLFSPPHTHTLQQYYGFVSAGPKFIDGPRWKNKLTNNGNQAYHNKIIF